MLLYDLYEMKLSILYALRLQFQMRSVSLYFIYKTLSCFSCYYESESSDMAPHLFRFCVLFYFILFLRNSRL